MNCNRSLLIVNEFYMQQMMLNEMTNPRRGGRSRRHLPLEPDASIAGNRDDGHVAPSQRAHVRHGGDP